MKTNSIKKYFLYALLAGTSFVTVSCEDSEDAQPGAYDNGVFVTSEGSYGTPNSEISFIPRTGSTGYIADLFTKINNRPLGDGAQHITFIGDKGYITLNNSKKIEVVDAGTFVSSGVINGLAIPRYIAALNTTKAYVTEYVGYTGNGRVSVLNLTNNTVTKTIPVGVLPEGLLVHNNKLYVANSSGNSVTVINTTTDAVETEIAVGESPRFLVADANNKIWVLRGGYGMVGALVKIDPANNNAVTTFNFPAGTSGAGQLAINGAKNTLVYSYNGKVYSMATSATALPTTSLINRDPYGLGVDPGNGNIYLGVGGYTTNGWAIRYQPTGAVIDSFQVRILPNGFSFR